MAKGRPNTKAASLKKAVETLADSIDSASNREYVEMWFAPHLRAHVAAGERAGHTWLAAEYRIPLHVSLRREAVRYRRILERASPPVTEPSRYAFEQVEDAYAAGFLYAVESFVVGLPTVLTTREPAASGDATPHDLLDAEVPH